MSEPAKRYRAFISYSQKDKGQARRLHRALEDYRVPAGVEAAGITSKTRKLGRFFRDDEEMGAAVDLGAALQREIADAENLIVVCSPHAAKSKWVNDEIIHFKRTGRADCIFAVIVAGAPNCGGERECFPPALRLALGLDGWLSSTQTEPLAVDLRKQSHSRAVARLVAGFTRIPFDLLWQREQRRMRLRLATMTLLVVIAAVAIAGAATQKSWQPWVDSYWRYSRFAHSAEWLEAAPVGAIFQDCVVGSADCPELVIVPSGSVQPGETHFDDAGTPYFRPRGTPVQIPRMAISRTEITLDQWAACAAAGGCQSQPNPAGADAQRGDLPVANVSWFDALEYVEWLSRMTGVEYHLLNEVAWEFGAAGIVVAEPPNLFRNALEDWTGEEVDHSMPVAQKIPNAFGLYDMRGNVAEWLADCSYELGPMTRDNSPIDVLSGASGLECSFRVVGGRSFNTSGNDNAAWRMQSYSAYTRSPFIGFRVARMTSDTGE